MANGVHAMEEPFANDHSPVGRHLVDGKKTETTMAGDHETRLAVCELEFKTMKQALKDSEARDEKILRVVEGTRDRMFGNGSGDLGFVSEVNLRLQRIEDWKTDKIESDAPPSAKQSAVVKESNGHGKPLEWLNQTSWTERIILGYVALQVTPETWSAIQSLLKAFSR